MGSHCHKVQNAFNIAYMETELKTTRFNIEPLTALYMCPRAYTYSQGPTEVGEHNNCIPKWYKH